MSSDHEALNITEKRLIVAVLDVYKDFPCLWDPNNDLYCNKDARSQALEVILEKWKTGYPNATIEEVKKKIEHLRAAYRRERKKVESSKSTGAGSGDVYTPSLWYYPYLSFLHEKTMPVSQGIDNIQGTPDSNSEAPATKKVKSSIKRQNVLYKKQEELIQSATELKKESNSPDTSADAFGRSVSSQLKELPKMQRCIVEKIIGDLLFYAKLGELTLDSSINLNKNIHTGTQSSYYTHPYRSHVYSPSPQYIQQPSPSPQYSQTSQSPKYSYTSPSPKHSQPSPSPQHSQTSQSPKYSYTSPSPKHSQPSPSPQHSQTSQSPKYSYTSPSPKHSQPSPSPQHSINLNKNIHTGTQSSYYTHPYRNHLNQQHSLPSSPSPRYIQQPSPSPQYSETSQSPKYSHTSPSPKHSQPSPSHQHSQPLSSPPHYLQESSSLRQQSTLSLPQTPADSITIYSADAHSQYLPLCQVLLPTDSPENITITNDTQLNPSGETQFNLPNTSASGSGATEVFRGSGKELKEFLILKK